MNIRIEVDINFVRQKFIHMFKCTKCKKRDAVITQKYSKRELCGPCFIDEFENRVYKANREFKLIRRGDRVAVAISGGKDSAALLYILTKIAKYVKAEVFPVLIDEGIANYREKAKEKAIELCEKLGLKLTVKTFQELFGTNIDKANAKKSKAWRGSCSYCGVFRKYALNAAALELKCNKIAVGHNADDVAQTILMNLTRNEPQRFMRFGAISGVVERDGFATRVKPLIYVTERECATYCHLLHLPIHLGECPYSSDSYRGDVKDFLNNMENKHPGTKFNIIKSFLAMKSNAEKIEQKEKQIKSCVECKAPSGGETCKACQFKKELT